MGFRFSSLLSDECQKFTVSARIILAGAGNRRRVYDSGSKLGIDATKKLPGEGFKREGPRIKMDAAR